MGRRVHGPVNNDAAVLAFRTKTNEAHALAGERINTPAVIWL